ncbi:MAG: integrase, partial [Planctomycetota bacterium]
MASITTRKNGSKFITFVDAAGERRHISLGKVPKRYAEALKVKVEDLASAALHGHAPVDDTVRWLASIDDRLYEKLAAVELAPKRSCATIGAWLEQCLDEREGDLKPESLRKLKQTKAKLLAHFDADTPL